MRVHKALSTLRLNFHKRRGGLLNCFGFLYALFYKLCFVYLPSIYILYRVHRREETISYIIISKNLCWNYLVFILSHP